MFLSRGDQVGFVGESVRFDFRPEGVDEAPVGSLPDTVDRCEITLGPAEQLGQLLRRVDIAVSAGEDAVIAMDGDSRVQAVSSFGHEVVVAGPAQRPCDMLGETTAGGRDLLLSGDPGASADDRVDQAGLHIRNRLSPELVIRQAAIRMPRRRRSAADLLAIDHRSVQAIVKASAFDRVRIQSLVSLE